MSDYDGASLKQCEAITHLLQVFIAEHKNSNHPQSGIRFGDFYPLLPIAPIASNPLTKMVEKFDKFNK